MEVNDSHFYQVFGVQIESQFELKELITILPCSNCDIIVRKSNTILRPATATIPANINFPITELKENYSYLELANIVQYEVRNNSDFISIHINILDPEKLFVIYAWFYGSVLTAALHMLEIFALHASALIGKQNDLILFSGRSGIGKSTIAANLYNKGYKIVTDDKCVLKWDQSLNRFIVQPAIQIIRLWEDAIDNLDSDNFLEDKTPVADKLNKFQFKINISIDDIHALQFKSLNIIRDTIPGSTLEVRKITGRRKLRLLQQQTHRVENIKALNKMEAHWNFIQRLANHCTINIILRPKGTTIEAFTSFVEEQLFIPKL